MRKFMLLLSLVALAAPIAAFASAPPTPTQTANAMCAADKATLGTAFVTTYATNASKSNAWGKCVSSHAKAANNAVNNASKSCKAQLADANFAAAHGGKTFAQFYGTGKNDKNALAKCASIKAQASSKAEQLARTNPARTCRTLRTQLVANTFIATFGTARNAFGKCTSWAAGLQTQSENAASATCRTAQDASATTFAANYTSNADAFGKCVSSTASAQAKAKLQATIAAVSACKAEQTNLAAFNAKYGSFKSCVAQNTKTA